MFTKDDIRAVPLPMEAMSAAGLHKIATSITSAQFADQGQVGSRFFIATPATKMLTLIQAKWADERQKAVMCYLVRRLMQMIGATHYTLASEVWIATVSKDTPGAERDKMPRERTDRREGVLILTADKNGTQGHTRYELVRRPGRPGTLKADAWTGFLPSGGRMSELLMSDEDIEVAHTRRQAAMADAMSR